jgi:hypothetical protein
MFIFLSDELQLQKRILNAEDCLRWILCKAFKEGILSFRSYTFWQNHNLLVVCWRYCKANLETKERIIGWGKKSCFCFFYFKMMDSCDFAARKFSRIQRDSSNLFWNPSVEHLRKWYEISWLNCAPNSEDWNEIFWRLSLRRKRKHLFLIPDQKAKIFPF